MQAFGSCLRHAAALAACGRSPVRHSRFPSLQFLDKKHPREHIPCLYRRTCFTRAQAFSILARQKKPAAGKAGWKRWYLSGMCPKGQHKTEGSALKAPLALDSVENHLNRKRRHPHNSFLSSKAAGIPAAWKPVCHYTAGKAKCQMKRE